MSYSTSQLALGYLLIFICAWTFAINCVMVRALSFLHSSVIMFWHGVIGIVMALGAIAVVALTTEQGFTIFSYDLQTYGLILAATMCDTLALNSQTIAFQSGSSGFISLISYFGVLYAFLSDCLIFHESFTWI